MQKILSFLLMSIKWIIEVPYYIRVFVISINNRSQYVLTSKEMSSTEKSMLHIPGRPAVIYYSLFRKRKSIFIIKGGVYTTRIIILLTPFQGIPPHFFLIQYMCPFDTLRLQ